ncbi:MAG TPA: hypothetical protein VGP64_01365, partial [Polyangia bacterium]
MSGRPCSRPRRAGICFSIPTVTRVEDLSDRALDEERDDPEDDDDDPDDEATPGDPPTRARWSPPPAVRARRERPQHPDWRALVEKASVGAQAPTPGAAPSTPLEIRYVVDVPASRVAGNLILRIATFDRQRDGNWIPSKPERLRQSLLGRLSDDRDRQVLCLLAGAGVLSAASTRPYYPHFSDGYADPVVPEIATI